MALQCLVLYALGVYWLAFLLVGYLRIKIAQYENNYTTCRCYKAAFMTSFAIALSNLILFKTVPQAGAFEIAAYLLAGPFAIICSMAAHDRFMKRKQHAKAI